jgi:Holliday junction DNA helicase RuvA
VIGFLQGRLLDKAAASVTLLVGGVGYEVAVDRQTLEGLPRPGDEVGLFVRTVVSQDDIRLFGFADAIGREVFDILRGIPNIGPKSASQILGGMPLPDLVAAVREKDLKRLTQIPGVGKKTAERLCLELAEKFALLPVAEPAAPSGIPRRLLDDVRSAITNLGFGPRDVESAVRALQAPEKGTANLETLVRQAIAHLSAR